MRRLSLLLVLPLLLAAAPPAHASDAQLIRVIDRTIDKVSFIEKRLDPDHLRTFGPFLARIARAAKLARSHIARVHPSTRQGARVRHAAVAALKELRVGARVGLLALNSENANLLALGVTRIAKGLAGLVDARFALDTGG